MVNDKDSFVVGIFFGALLCCWFMVIWPKPITCEVTTGDLNHTHIRIGVIVE